MSHKVVRGLLESRLAAWAAARSPVLRIAWQNVAFTPAAGETYLAAYLLPAATNAPTLEGTHRDEVGVFQVSVIAPANAGSGGASGIADEVAALYPHLLRLTGSQPVQVTAHPHVAAPIQDDTTFTVPVSIRYRSLF